jgi:hypothetical protein
MKRLIICTFIICLSISIISCNKSESINQVTNIPSKKTDVINVTLEPITNHTDEIDSSKDINENKSKNQPNQMHNKSLEIAFLDDLFKKCYTASFITHDIPSMDMIEKNQNTEIFMQWLKDTSNSNKEIYDFTDVIVSTEILNSKKQKGTIKYFVYVKVNLENINDTENAMKCGFEYDIVLRNPSNENDSYKVVDIELLSSEYKEYIYNYKKNK